MNLERFFRQVWQDPYPLFARMREQAPVVPIPGTRVLAITRHHGVVEALKRPTDFSSEGVREGLAALRGEAPELRPPTLISMDPPEHTRLRGLVSRAFTTRQVARLEPRVRELARELLGGVRDKGRFDLVQDFSTPLPIRVIAEMLGVEPERHAEFKRWSDALVITSFPPSEEVRLRAERAREALEAYFEPIISERRRAPREDLVSALVQAEEGPQHLTPREVVDMGVLLLVAGNITTTYLIANAMKALLQHPRELARLRATPALIPQAVEEALRYDGPVLALFRKTTHEVELEGERIPGGTLVYALIGSANRDERVFAEPDRFDVLRDAKHHIAFGHGVHFCVGAPLARLETRVALEVLLGELPGLAFDGELHYVESLFLRGPRTLPLRLTDGWRVRAPEPQASAPV